MELVYSKVLRIARQHAMSCRSKIFTMQFGRKVWQASYIWIVQTKVRHYSHNGVWCVTSSRIFFHNLGSFVLENVQFKLGYKVDKNIIIFKRILSKHLIFYIKMKQFLREQALIKRKSIRSHHISHFIVLFIFKKFQNLNTHSAYCT